MARITTSKGEARLRPMLAREAVLLGDLADLEDTKDWQSYYRLLGKMVAALDDARISVDWDGDFGDVPPDEVPTLLLKWDNATDEEAVPNASEPSSETPPDAGR